MGYLALVVTAVWADLPGIFTPDTLPGLYTSPARLLSADLSAWVTDPFLGAPNLQTGRAPVSAVFAAVAATGLPDWALVRLWQSLLLIVAAFGARALHRRLAGPAGTGVGNVAMAVVYTANPYVVVGGSTTPTLLPYALLPWAAAAIYDAMGQRSWRPAAAFALIFFLMSGIQVGVVPLLQLLVLPCLAIDARLRRSVPWMTILSGTLRCGLLAVAVSIYWLAPGLLAVPAGTAVAMTTESLAVINGPSSVAEVLRGLGMWTMYGRDATGPFQPGFLSYLTSPFVVVTSFALPALAALGAAATRSRLRLLGVLLVAVSVPVMVGLHPYDHPTPFGHLLGRAFISVPGLIAFRTTNKAGGVLLLGLALLVALGVDVVRERVPWPAARAVIVVTAGVVLVGSVAPAVTGQLHPVQLRVPAYWRAAAAAIDESGVGRVLVLPGSQIPRYRWGYTSPADFLDGLFTRGTIQRQISPGGSPQAADLLAATDTALQEGRLVPGTLSAVAQRLGVRDLLLRNDTVWEQVAGARPSEIAAQVAADPGLEFIDSFGRPGENVVAPGGRGTPEQVRADAALPPLQHFRVRVPQPQIRAEGAAGMVLVDGDNSALPDLVQTGLLPAGTPYMLLGGMTGDEIAKALHDGARVVLTDTNRRRVTNPGRLTAGYGPTLPAQQSPDRLVSLFGEPRAQTVAVLPGASVTATQSGSLFGPVPYGAPSLALDGDPQTGWIAGDFGSAVGQRLDLRLDAPARVSKVVLRPLETGAVKLAAVRLRVGALVRDVVLTVGVDTVVELPTAQVQEISVTVLRLTGTGPSPAGLAELRLDGLTLEPSVELPRTLPDLFDRSPKAVRALLERAPLDVLLSRSRSLQELRADDEESRLSRTFQTRGDRTYVVTGILRAGPDLGEVTRDVVSGGDPLLAAHSSSHFFDDPAYRASAAFDGDPNTAWVPGGHVVGESVTLAFPSRKVDRVVIRQQGVSGDLVDLVTRARVDLEDGRTVETALRAGATVVPLPPGRRVSFVRVTLLARAHKGALVRIQDIDIGGLRIRPDTARAAHACLPVAALSGAVLHVHADPALLLAGRPAPFTSCDPPIRLGPGTQQLRTAPGWLLDQVHLADQRRAVQAAGAQVPGVSVLSADSTSVRLRVTGAAGPYVLVLGQGWDPRWRAAVNSHDLGRPLVVDGWSSGWRVNLPGDYIVQVDYGPQQLTEVARAVSASCVLLCLLLLLMRRPGMLEQPQVEPSRRNRRQRAVGILGAWAGGVGLMWLVGGALLGGAGVLLASGWFASQRLRTAVPWLGALLLAGVPIARLLAGLGDSGNVSAQLVSGGFSEQLAMVGFGLLVAGVVAQELTREWRSR